MAEVAVGWAISALGWITSPVVTRLLREASDLLAFDASERLRTLPRLALLLEQADRIPPGLQRAQLEQWTNSLRSAFYDAEDILDVVDYHRLEKQVISRSGVMTALDRAKDIISGKTSKLKKIIDKLEKIIEEGSRFLPLLISTTGNGTNGSDTDISNPANRVTGTITTSSALTEVIIGRDKERDEILRMLHETAGDSEPSSWNNKCYSVIGIYGIGGSGKTTLAQHVCSYERRDKYFFLIMWVHVSQSFNVSKIYREMLEAASGESSNEFCNLDSLQMKLEAALTGKRFLLVLDDIWPEKDVSSQLKLDQLLSPLKVGKRGSKVLVTTRFADVAMSLGSRSTMQIPDIDEKDFLQLFMHYALDGVILDSLEVENFQTIGGEIAKKLKGSPLAARLVGARLRKHSNTMFWRRVGDQDLLTDTMGALWWSYRQLDGQVKRCFAYCSMFPPGHVFKRDNLVKLWMAEDFIKTTLSVEQMEYAGQKYFDELVSCSFLQATKNTNGSENETFSMHDLLHELAVMISGKDCFRVEEGDQMKEFPPDVRHLYVSSYDPMKLAEQICKLKKLRTLIIDCCGFSTTTEAFERIVKKLKKLRVVQAYINVERLMIPSCICDLKHLRSLTLISFRLRKVHLPRNLDKLYHLQILDLRYNGVLDFSRVENMSNLVSLWHVRNHSDWYLNDYSDMLGFPSVSELKSLRELSDFTVRKEKGYELKQLVSLNQLRGSLRISGLENVESKERALEAKLTDKKYLTALSLAWSGDARCSPDIQLEILEGLCPPPQLTELEIDSYGGVKYPSWLTQSFRSLQCLKLKNCSNLEALPDICELFIHLRKLTLDRLPKLERLPTLPDSLKSLVINLCDSLVLTCIEDVEMIRSAIIERASQIEPSLNITIHPEEIDRFANEQPDKFDRIMLDIFGRCVTLPHRLVRGQVIEEDLSQFLFPTSADSLHFSYCAITDTVLHNWLRGSTSLTTLTLMGIPFIRSIPSVVMKSLTVLQYLWIMRCAQLTCLQGLNHLSTLRSLTISKCPNLMTALPEDEKARVLHELTIDDIYLVPQLLSREGFTSLQSLTLWDIEPEERRGEEMLEQLASLTSLAIDGCNWNRLPESLVTLTCLQHLSLMYCKNIRSLPTLPASLRVFSLNMCDQSFMKSCQTVGHPNYQRIAHVPCKEIVSDE